jgi:hypothetical protein
VTTAPIVTIALPVVAVVTVDTGSICKTTFFKKGKELIILSSLCANRANRANRSAPHLSLGKTISPR